MAAYSKALLFYNQKAGQGDNPEQKQKVLSHFTQKNIAIQVVDVFKPQDEIETIIKRAIDDGVDLFLAAGGDGTVSMVGSHLVGKNKTLGIIPLGTGNLLAKELMIPQKIEDVLEMITSSETDIFKMDTFLLGERYYILNVSVGVTPKVMEDTESEHKQQFGFIAYLLNFFQQILGLKLRRFFIDFDGQKNTYLASEILITNGKSIGIEGLKWSGDVALNDGALDLLIIRAANIYDIFRLLISVFTKTESKNPIIKIHTIKQYCQISSPTPVLAQADGDVIGNTPIKISVNPRSLNIIINKESKN